MTVHRLVQAERGRIEHAEAILGLGRRHIESMAATGKLPGAAKFGRRWTFDLDKLRDYVRHEEERQCLLSAQKHRVAATGEGIPSGAVLSLRAKMSDGPLKRTIRELQRSVGKLAKTA